MKTGKLNRKSTNRMRALWVAALMLCACGIGQAQEIQDRLGGHIGFVLPLITHEGGQTTTLDENFGIGFPVGITIKGSGRTAFDLEFVPFVQGSPRNVSLTVHPGILYGLGHGFTLGTRLVFDLNSSQFGFTPLLNKSWPIHGQLLQSLFR